MKQILKKKTLTAGLLIILGVVLYNCGGSGGGYGGGGSSPPPSASTVQVVSCATVTTAVSVSATEYVFTSSAVHVPVGGVVKWTNDSTANMEHSVTSGSPPGTPDGMFDQTMLPGQSVCLKFTTAGTYNYYCKFHFTLGMVGSVTAP
jgi:plastocyanin